MRRPRKTQRQEMRQFLRFKKRIGDRIVAEKASIRDVVRIQKLIVSFTLRRRLGIKDPSTIRKVCSVFETRERKPISMKDLGEKVVGLDNIAAALRKIFKRVEVRHDQEATAQREAICKILSRKQGERFWAEMQNVLAEIRGERL